MEPVASGRDCEMFDAGPGRLLRRARNRRSIEPEARIITYLHERGYPVPEIYDVSADGTEVVMERVDGPNMGDALMRRPWKLKAYANRLADLHDDLHTIPVPPWPDFRSMGDGNHLLHLDFHPLNVVMGPQGPVVVDWTNAAAGNPLLDAAVTYVLLTCPRLSESAWVNRAVQPGRTLLGRAFATRYRGPAFDEQLARAGDLKALDTNLASDEASACRRVSEQARRRIAAAG